MNRKVFIRLQLATLFLANVSIGAAQQPMKIPRIGFLSGSGNVVPIFSGREHSGLSQRVT